MGSSNNKKDQIINYYLFHKKIECIYKNKYNPFASAEVGLEKFFVVKKELVKIWMAHFDYNLYKYYFDEIFDFLKCNNNFSNFKPLIEQKYDTLQNVGNEGKFGKQYNDNNFEETMWFNKNILTLENFDNLLDEATYYYFKSCLSSSLNSEIEGIILDDKIILFYKNYLFIKFIYYEQLVDSNLELVQLTADFSTMTDEGYCDYEMSLKAYEITKSNIISNLENILYIFKRDGILYLKEVNISLDTNSYLFHFILRNENLSLRYKENTYKMVNYQKITSDKFRLIGLANVGATCYMNATLQCFINVPFVTKFLLIDTVYKKITENSSIYELSSSYCHLLYNVCCNEQITNYFEPTNFKEVISGKNPLFKGINANDSKDLINFMLEEMNQELSHLDPPKNNYSNNNINMHMNQADKYTMLNLFKQDFSQNNNSIIAKNFFFITETKTVCESCKSKKYNYQVLYLLEFPLEPIFKYCNKSGINCFDNQGNICINLESGFLNYMDPVEFCGENQLYCNTCHKLSSAKCANRIFSLPKTLIIILNRGKGNIFKASVNFPSELNLKKFVLCPQSIAKYELTGVISHIGESGMGGHFIAFCKHRIQKQWYKYNDAIVTFCQNQYNDFKIGTPYILFYESIDDGKNNVLFDEKKVDNSSFKSNGLNKSVSSINNMNMMNNNNMININNNLNLMKMNSSNNNYMNKNMNPLKLSFNGNMNMGMNMMNNNNMIDINNNLNLMKMNSSNNNYMNKNMNPLKLSFNNNMNMGMMNMNNMSNNNMLYMNNNNMINMNNFNMGSMNNMNINSNSGM